MILRFIGGDRDGERHDMPAFDINNPPAVWRMPKRRPALSVCDPLTAEIDFRALDVEDYELDGFYVRWSTRERVALYKFRGVSS